MWISSTTSHEMPFIYDYAATAKSPVPLPRCCAGKAQPRVVAPRIRYWNVREVDFDTALPWRRRIRLTRFTNIKVADSAAEQHRT